MRKNWLSNEGKKWVEKGIITEQQLQGIMGNYRFEPRNTNLILYMIAGVLCGLGILAAIAANWDYLLPLYKLLVLIVGMSGFYLTGEILTRRNRPQFGAIAIGLGVITFGGALILCGQIFQWTAYDARVFVLWSIISIASLYLYRNRSLFLLTLLLLMTGQIYSVNHFQSTSWGMLILTMLLSIYAEQVKSVTVTWSITVALIVQAIWAMTFGTTLSFGWIFPILLGIYILGELLKQTQWKEPLQFLATLTTFILVIVYTPSYSFYWQCSVVGLLAFAVILKLFRKEFSSIVELLLFLPFCFILLKPAVIYQLLTYVAAFSWSIYRMIQGMREGSRTKTNVGSILFLIAILNTYFNVAWDVIPRSVFFLSSGLLLFLINLFLQKQKARFNKYMAKGDAV